MRSALIALVALMVVPCVADAGTRWEHPWMHPRMFDYRHSDWQGFDALSFFGYVTVEAETTMERLPDGSLRFVWDAEMQISDPSKLPELLELDSLSAARNTRVVAFEARFSAKGEPVQVLDRRRLVERAAAQHAMYFDGDTVLSLIPPRERPGRLTIHLETVSEPHEGFEDYFGGVQFVQLSSPCVKRTIRLRVPEDEQIRYESRFFDSKPKQRVRKGVRQVEFTFENLLPSFSDGAMPPSLDAFPSLIYSNQPSWESLGEIAKAAWDPHLVSEPGMDAWAKELVAGLGDDRRAWARAIHDAVGDGWGYLGFYPGESGWIPHAATVCYSARLGDCKDRTALMVVLMRSLGLDASPTILWSGEAFVTPRVPVLVANHAVVHVDPGDGGPPLFLDSVDVGIGSNLLRETLSDRDALVLGEPAALVAIPPAKKEHWLEEDEAFVSVQPDGSAKVFLVRNWHGQEAATRKQMHAGPDRILWEHALRERLAATYPETRVESIVQHADPDNDQVWRLEVTLSSRSFVQRMGSLGVLSPPWIVRWSRDVGPEERRHPRSVEGSWFRSTVRIFLPRGVEVVHAPQDADATGGGLLQSSLDVQSRSGELALTLDVQSKPGRIPIDEVGERADFYRSVAIWQDQSVVLRFPAEDAE
ncbi:MAG: transglutaminase domain-containing protein [Deltaproteobacteria bacterium]|nr:transglutaminase domain-containing protein [Deltaproteobacteria bacterium]